jgi:hypothetical protein
MRRSSQANNQIASSNFTCFACKESLKPGDTAICADDIEKNALLHPNCFTCVICNELLADLVYYTKNKEMFCEKHFHDLKTCSGCNDIIKSSEYVLAENKYWHNEHFKCSFCHLSIANQKYLVKESDFYCFSCHEDLFPKYCETCGEKIASDDLKFTYENLNWHSDPFCFRCSCCHKDLLECHFLIKKNKLFCGIECKKKFISN